MRERYWRNREQAKITWDAYYSQNKEALNARRRAARAAKR
jgi:hypothetical protein